MEIEDRKISGSSWTRWPGVANGERQETLSQMRWKVGTNTQGCLLTSTCILAHIHKPQTKSIMKNILEVIGSFSKSSLKSDIKDVKNKGSRFFCFFVLMLGTEPRYLCRLSKCCII